MAKYIVNIERIIALDLEVDIDDPKEGVEKAREMLSEGTIDWADAKVDQVAACCLATGFSSFTVIGQKDPILETGITQIDTTEVAEQARVTAVKAGA